jgi:hypothetical protein
MDYLWVRLDSILAKIRLSKRQKITITYLQAILKQPLKLKIT